MYRDDDFLTVEANVFFLLQL